MGKVVSAGGFCHDTYDVAERFNLAVLRPREDFISPGGLEIVGEIKQEPVLSVAETGNIGCLFQEVV
jgi:hypothetical protein